MANNHSNKAAGNRGTDGKFLPRNNANPNGRPKKDVSITSLLKKYLDEVPAIKVEGKDNTQTWRELLCQAWLVGAYKGNATLFKELLERIEGKVPQPIGGQNGEAIPVRITYEHTSSRKDDQES